MSRWAVLLALALAACVTKSPDTGLREVAVSCVAVETPKAPDVHSPDQLAKIPDGPTLFTMAAADYENLYQWMLRAAPALEGCRAAASRAGATDQYARIPG